MSFAMRSALETMRFATHETASVWSWRPASEDAPSSIMAGKDAYGLTPSSIVPSEGTPIL